MTANIQPTNTENGPALSRALVAPQKPKLLDSVREELRLRHYSLRTEQAYLGWMKRFIFFHGKSTHAN